ncbi:MAG TPA: DUF4410 domain-containing protein [Thermoanaerobaculia bacterium]|jgi:hypothetical protein|nr:DUF4410 domain-containing protein [Thermoanaerobaculia bacterium]
MKIWLRIALALALLAFPGAAAFAKDKKPAAPTTPGKYTEWGGEIDELEVVAPFRLAEYSHIAVEPFDNSETPLPDADDNSYAPAKAVLAKAAHSFTEGLSESLPKLQAAVTEPGKEAGPGTLVVRGKVTTMDPGSKAARYWGGFGAGAARTEISGEVVDAGSGKVLLRFLQERRSGWGLFGGDYEKLMNRNLRAIGEDLAGALTHF